MAEFFPQGKKRMFPHKVLVYFSRNRSDPAPVWPIGPRINSFKEYADGEELGGRYKYGNIRPAPKNKSEDYEVPFFFSNDKAALAFKIRFG